MLALLRVLFRQASKMGINELVTLYQQMASAYLAQKLWRKLKQDVLHLHRWADNLEILRERVLGFFKPFACGSTELLQAIGLRIPD